MKRHEAEAYRRQMVDGAKDLSDTEALKVPMLYDRWQAGTDYEISLRLYYEDKLYKVLQAHTSHEAYTPDIAVSLYAEVLIPDPSVIPEWVQPGSTNPYMMGDKVRHNGHIWISTMDYNVFEPGVAGWEVVE